jgi:hypothetical protein
VTLRTLFCHDVTVVRAAADVDRYDNAVKDWADATRTVTRGRVAQRTRDENRSTGLTVGEERVITEWVVYLPAGTDILPTDRLEWSDGSEDFVFEIKGRPHRAFSRRTEHHVELTCDLVEG